MLQELPSPEVYYIALQPTQPYYSFVSVGRNNIVFPFSVPFSNNNQVPMSQVDYDAWALNLTANIGYNELWVVRTIITPPAPNTPVGITYPYVTMCGLAYRKSNEVGTLNAFNGTWTVARPPSKPNPFYDPLYDPTVYNNPYSVWCK